MTPGKSTWLLPVAAGVWLLVAAGTVEAAGSPSATVDGAAQTLEQIMAIPVKGIPRSLLADAEGIAIVPDVVKLGFVVAGRHGKGVVLVRNPNGSWSNPVFVAMTGGSVGWQVGVQATDVILVFKSRKSVAGLLGGKFTLGADAAVAAGPVGRQAAAATDARLKAEIYSYSRSRGLFAGVSLEGSAVTIDDGANATYYGRFGVRPADIQAGQVAAVPASAARLQALLAKYAPPAPGRILVATDPPLPGPPQPAAVVEPGRRALAASSRQLAARLDDAWQRYLALPAEVYADGPPPSVEALRFSLTRFEKVRADPRYRPLVAMPEFQATDELLRKYLQARSTKAARGPLPRPVLPPPPGGEGARR